MSYYYLAHNRIPITRLTDASQALIDGKMTFGSNSSSFTFGLTDDSPSTLRRRRTQEFDEDEELDRLEEIEAANEPVTAKANGGTTASLQPRRDEFDSFSQIFRSSLPANLFPNATANYQLLQYVEQTVHGSEKHDRLQTKNIVRIPILFLAGNGGNYHQMRSLATRLNTIWNEERQREGHGRKKNPVPDLNDYYAIDYHEESGAFNGRLLWRQAWFANEALHHILSLYPPNTRAILVGHSMGGIVARTMSVLNNYPRIMNDGNTPSVGRVDYIVTLGTPHRSPVVTTDEYLRRLYQAINRPVRATTNTKKVDAQLIDHSLDHLSPLIELHLPIDINSLPLLISVGGGERDFQIEPALTKLDDIYPPSRSLSLLTHSIYYTPVSASGGLPSSESSNLGLTSVDHQSLCWCRQLIETLAWSIYEITKKSMEKGDMSNSLVSTHSIESQRRIWLPPVLTSLREVAEIANGSSSSSSDFEPQEWNFFDRDFAASTDRIIRVPSVDLSRVGDGIIFVWNGWMSEITLCHAQSTKCIDLTHLSHMLSPGLHHEHSATLTPSQREAKRIGTASSYMMRLSKSDIATVTAKIGSSSAAVINFKLTESSHLMFQQLRPLRDSKKRLLLAGFTFVVESFTTSLPRSLPNRGGVYRVIESIPAGIDLHRDLRITLPRRGENDHVMPALVVMTTESSANSSQVKLSSVDYTEQLYTFYPPMNTKRRRQTRQLHIYRSGLPRTLSTIMVRIPQIEGDDAKPSVRDLKVSVYDHTFISFIDTLYLQFSLLPQLLLGCGLILFGVQHEYLRKYGQFPRMYELLLAPVSGGVKGCLSASTGWSLLAIGSIFYIFFHGSLVGDPLQFTRTSNSDHLTPSTAIISGWSFASQASTQVSMVGFILFLAGIMLIVFIDSVLYYFLWLGSSLIRSTWSILTCPFSFIFSSSTSSSSSNSSQLSAPRRYWNIVARQIILVLWVMIFLLAVAFTSSLGIFTLKYYGGMALGETIYFIGEQTVAWISTALFMFGIISEHFYWKDIVNFVIRHFAFHDDLSILPLITIIFLFTLCLQMATFPRISSSEPHMRGGDSRKRQLSLSSAAYKTSGITITCIIMILLLGPTVLSSFRVDPKHVNSLWHQQKQLNQHDLAFAIPGSSRIYDTTLVRMGESDSPSSPSSSIFLYPFALHAPVDPLTLIVLTWLTLISWCLFHTPFSPPILQSACITTYGLALLFVTGPSVGMVSLWWIILMMSLCMIPHAMASGLFIINIMLDFIEGREGHYEMAYQQETDKIQAQREGRQQPPAPSERNNFQTKKRQ